MFFMLSKRIKDNHWDLLGIVAALSIEEAAKKMGREIDEKGAGRDSCLFCFLVPKDDGVEYSLEEYKEIAGPI